MTDETRWWLIGTGVLMGVGAFLPWVQAGIFSLAGTSGDGVFVLIAGVIVALVGLSRKATVITGLGVIGVSLFSLWIVGRIMSDLSSIDTLGTGSSMGSGLIVSGLGALFALIAGFKTLNQRVPAPAVTDEASPTSQ